MASGTEFLIEIQQRITGDNAVTELQKTEQALKSAMATYGALESSVAKTERALTKVGASIAATRERMQKAMDAGDAGSFWKLASALGALEKKQEELTAASSKARASLTEQEHAVTNLAASTIRLRSEEKAAADAAKKVGVDTIKASDGISKLPGPAGRAGGALKGLQEGWRDLRGQLGTGGAAFAVAGVAIVAVTAALLAGVIALGSYGLKLASAQRDASLLTQALQIQVGAGAELVTAMRAVERDTGVAADRQRDIVRSLKDAGVAAGDMPSALRAIATQESALGDTSGTQALIDDLKAGKKGAAALASEMDSKFGGIVRKRMLGLEQQSDTLRRNISGLFEGLDIEPILAGIAKLVALFDANTVSGKALQALLGALFSPLGNNATGVFTKIERFMLGMELGALRVMIAAKKVSKALGFDTSSMSSFIDLGTVGESVAAALAIGIVAIGLALYAVVAPIQLLSAAWDGLVVAAKAAWTAITTAVDDAVTALKAIDLSQVGKDMVAGLVKGVKAATPSVGSAFGAIGVIAEASLRKESKTHSPSEVFADVGEDMGAGVPVGLERSAPRVERAIERLVAVPSAPQLKAATTAAQGGSITISVGDIVVSGVQGAEDLVQRVRDEVMSVLEEAALHLGALQTGGASA